jgi:hypothetical protein
VKVEFVLYTFGIACALPIFMKFVKFMSTLISSLKQPQSNSNINIQNCVLDIVKNANITGQTIMAGELWKDSTSVIFVVRRPG